MAFDPSTARPLDAGGEMPTITRPKLSFDPSTALPAPLAALRRPAPPPSTTRTWGEAASDVGRGVMSGAAGLVKTGGDLYGLATGNMDNPVSRIAGDAQQYWEEGQSAGLKQAKADRSAAIDAADSVPGKIGTAIWQTIKRPSLLADTAASNIMTMLPAGAAARGAKVVAGALGAGGQAAARMGLGAAIGTSAVQQGSDSASSTYDASLQQTDWASNPEWQQRVAAGEDPEAAKRAIALSAARMTLPAATAISAASQAIPGGTVLERALVGGAARGVLTRPGVMGRAIGAARGVLGEGSQEAIEEGGGQLVGNLIRRETVDPNADVWQDVGENAGIGFVGGGILGGPAGALHGAHVTRPVANQPFPNAEPGTVSDAANAVSGAAAPAGPATPTVTRPKPGAQPVQTEAFPGAPAGSLQDAANAIQTPTPRYEPSPYSTLDAKTKARDAALRKPAIPEVPPPWVNPDTGEARTPDAAEIHSTMLKVFEGQIAAGQRPKVRSVDALARDWGVKTADVLAARHSALQALHASGSVAVDGTTVEKARRAVEQAQDQQQLERSIRAPAVGADPSGPATPVPAASTEPGTPPIVSGTVPGTPSTAAPAEGLPGVAGGPAAQGNLSGPLDEATGNVPASTAEAITERPADHFPDAGKMVPQPAAEDRDARLRELRQQRNAGALAPEGFAELVDLQEADRVQARVAGNGAPINGVRKIDALAEDAKGGKITSEGRIFADADNFKNVNDAFGHPVGDSLIKQIGETLAAHFPNQVYHRGGDEFVIASGTDPANADTLMAKVREDLAAVQMVGVDAAGNEIRQNGIGLSYGYGTDAVTAENAQRDDKDRRKRAGLRTDRADNTPGTPDRRTDGGGVEEAGVQADISPTAEAGRPGLQDAGEVAPQPVSPTDELPSATQPSAQQTDAAVRGAADNMGAAPSTDQSDVAGEVQDEAEAQSAPESAASRRLDRRSARQLPAESGVPVQGRAAIVSAQEPADNAPAIAEGGAAAATTEETSAVPTTIRESRIVGSGPDPVAAAADSAAASPNNDLPTPTVAQQAAGNAKAGHVRLHGLDVTIQVPKNGVRTGTDAKGKTWKRRVADHYGHIRRTTGADGEQIDVYLGPKAADADARVFVIDQVKPGTSDFDEHKAMIGFPSGQAARASYERNFPKGLKVFGGLREMSIDEFKDWAKSDAATKPVALPAPVVNESLTTEPAGSFLQAAPAVEATPKATDGHTQKIEAAVRAVTAQWGSGRPEVKVLQDPDDLPRVARANARYRQARGFYDGKTAYLVAPNLATERDALTTLAHEAVGHHGVEAILNDHVKGGWDALVRDVDRLFAAPAPAAESIRPAIDDVRRRYPGADPTTRAKELLAVMAERGLRNSLTGRLVAAVRAFVRKIMPNVSFREADLLRLLAKSDAYLRADAPATASNAAASFSLAAPRKPVSIDAAIIGGALGDASKHPDYAAAKAGDFDAGVRIARSLVTDDLVARVKAHVGDEKPLVVPVASIEATGRNKIPITAAALLATRLGTTPAVDIVQVNSPHRTGMDGLDRLFASPEFAGAVEPGRDYLLLDDTLTQGATLAALASHIEAGGGRVVGAVALTGKQYSSTLKPSKETLQQLQDKHGDLEEAFREATGHGFDALTESEARYLARYEPAERVRDRIAAERDRARQPAGDGTVPQSAVAASVRSIDPPAFAESKVRSKDGRLLPVYHGTPFGRFDEFTEGRGQRNLNPNNIGAGVAFFTISKGEAQAYANGYDNAAKYRQMNGYDPQVIEAFLNIKKPKIVFGLYSKVDRAALEKAGYDGINFVERNGDNEWWVPFRTDQILVKASDRRAPPSEGRDGFGRGNFSLPESPQPTFFSALSKAVATGKGAPRSANAVSWKQWLDGRQRNGEFKGDERAWLGVDAWLDSQTGPVTKQQLADFVAANEVAINETMLTNGPPGSLPAGWVAARATEDQLLDGFDDWIVTDEDGSVVASATSREQAIARGIADNEPDESPKFATYTLPGGENYRELLLTLPRKATASDLYDQSSNFQHAMHEKYGDGWRLKASQTELAEDARLARAAEAVDGVPQNFQSNHFDQPNVLAHIRFNERSGVDGKQILFVEEVQSDWHQEGRKRGYDRSLSANERGELNRLEAKFVDGGTNSAERERLIELRRISKGGVPDAPFKTTWPLLAMRRAIRWAAENGFDRVAWTTGEQQAARYDLSKQVDSIEWSKKAPREHLGERGNSYSITATKEGDDVLHKSSVFASELPNLIGKELADRIVSSEDNGGSFTGGDLKVGGEGMRAFYDRLLPNELNKYVKRWGTKVETVAVPITGEHTLRNGDLVQDTFPAHSIAITPQMRDSVMQGQALFSMPAESVDALTEVASKPDESIYQRAKGWAAGKWRDFQPTALGALQLRHLLEIGEPLHPGMKGYADLNQQMQAERNQLLERVGVQADVWRNWASESGLAGLRGRMKPEAKALNELMHDATLLGLDPSKEYQPLTFLDSREKPQPFDRKAVAARIKEIRGQIRGRPGDDKTAMMDQIKYLKALPALEAKRIREYPGLVARWQALGRSADQLHVVTARGKVQGAYATQKQADTVAAEMDGAVVAAESAPQAVFRAVRDYYDQHSLDVLDALVDRVKALEVPETYRRGLIDRLRMQFETQRLAGVYFPLQRFGDYWLSAKTPDGQQVFSMFESFREFEQASKRFKDLGYTIEGQGRKDANYKAKDAPSGTFVAEIMAQLKKSGAPEAVQDEIYQLYLKSMPELSMRKHSIHRKGTAGYSADAVRAFAKNGFHGSHQLAKLRYSHLLQSSLDALQLAADNRRKDGSMDAREAAAADSLLTELRKRHDWIMSPKDSQVANMATSIGFLYYLGATPAAAIVNLLQGPQVTFPALGARFGFAKAGRMLAAATRDSMRTFGNINRTLSTDDDRNAYRILQARGDIEKTQAHSLAGIAEGDHLRTNPTYAKVMNGVGFLFGRMEVINREAAGMAAFRLARSEGMAFDKAVQYASDVINGTHLDYSNANRARFMQGNVQKVLLQFRSYSLGMSWFVGRNAYQMFKGESPEVRQQARRTIAGVMGMSALLSGVMGLPFMGALGMVAGALQSAFGDDDEPWDFKTEFRAFLADHFGADGARWIADGAVNPLGADVAGRVGMADLWFRDADRELEGRDAYYHALEQIAGPMGGIAKNLLVGKQQIGDGQVWRGVETMLPKFIKDSMKAVRFHSEGANTLRGDPLIEEVTAPEQLIQLLGFTPTRLREQYRENSAAKNYEQHILDRRQSLINAFALASRYNDAELRAAAITKMQAFSRTYPELAITASTIRRSMQTRARYSAQAEGGVVLNKRIAERVRDQVAG